MQISSNYFPRGWRVSVVNNSPNSRGWRKSTSGGALYCSIMLLILRYYVITLRGKRKLSQSDLMDIYDLPVVPPESPNHFLWSHE